MCWVFLGFERSGNRISIQFNSIGVVRVNSANIQEFYKGII